MKILDVCCGSRMFWYDKHEPHTTYMDIRQEDISYADRQYTRKVRIQPDVIGDFRAMPFPDNTFDHVVFDPPHLIHAGPKSWLRAKYGVLNAQTWQEDLRQGINECLRVLKPTGTLTFKWNDDQIAFSQVLKVTGRQPIYGDKRGKTRWTVFIKEDWKDY